MKKLSGKVAAITGAGSGIGRELAKQFAEQGCHLALSDVNESGLVETKRLIEAESKVTVTITQLDVSACTAVKSWADEVFSRHGKVNILINNAGVGLGASLVDVSIEDFNWLMNINFWGVVYGTQAFLPHLIASGDGHIVNISSSNGLIGMPKQGTYCASKFAVRGYTESLRMDLTLEGLPVGVSCVHPGYVSTNIAKAARLNDKLVKDSGQSEEVLRRHADMMQQLTSVQSAARKIIAGVRRNEPRVLIGPDAWIIDKLSRILGVKYQPIVEWVARREMGRISRT